jgi:hypothetical protein
MNNRITNKINNDKLNSKIQKEETKNSIYNSKNNEQEIYSSKTILNKMKKLIFPKKLKHVNVGINFEKLIINTKRNNNQNNSPPSDPINRNFSYNNVILLKKNNNLNNNHSQSILSKPNKKKDIVIPKNFKNSSKNVQNNHNINKGKTYFVKNVEIPQETLEKSVNHINKLNNNSIYNNDILQSYERQKISTNSNSNKLIFKNNSFTSQNKNMILMQSNRIKNCYMKLIINKTHSNKGNNKIKSIPFSLKKNKQKINTNTENNNPEIDNENINLFTFSNYSKTHGKNNSEILKPFNINDEFLSPINNNKNKSYFNKDEIINDFNSTSKKKKIPYDNKNRVKNNNYVNIFDSCNNLNNYYFQFQTPSTVISFNDNKKFNNLFLNNTNKNKNEINILSYSSPFSFSSKVNSNRKKFISPRTNLKPTNLINNLKYCVSDRKNINNKNNISNSNTINVGEFGINKNNIKNLYTMKSKSSKKNKIINNLLYGFSKEKNTFTINSKNNNDQTNNNINSLLKRTFCYFRILNNNNNNNNDNNKIFNPFDNKSLSLSTLCKSPYNYIKSTLNFNKKEDMLIIIPSNQLESINIKIDKIENTFISPDMKIIIDIYKGYKDFKNKYDNGDINKYIKEIKKININYKHLKDEEIIKCCHNKNFVLSISIKNKKKRIEFLFCSYEEFKLWNNAICFFINNNNEFLFNLNNRKKFEYP